MPESRGEKDSVKYNRLINEKSPYLLQHAHNPVDWFPWGEEAFRKAHLENKPIFLSIGYSTCHWCHVMERESFENPGVADLMNRVFVPIKVDREERPDIDNVYMAVCQMMTGSGGWPLTIFMTPDKKPFFAGTYIPRNSSYGRAGMLELIPRVEELWIKRRNDLLSSAGQITAGLQTSRGEYKPGRLDQIVLHNAYRQFAADFDDIKGGFGKAPKFPSPHNLMFLLRYWKRSGEKQALSMVVKTLQEMREGGIFDQVGFGFHRYSTDSRWFLPHFEKMLYDQAMLTIAYIEAYQATSNPQFRETAMEILEYVARDLIDPKGGFYSAEDADSEKEEGKFYLFTKAEILKILEEDEAKFMAEVFNITATGNFAEESSGQKTGKNILYLAKSYSRLADELKINENDLRKKIESARKKIFAYRKNRIHPSRDDKILTDWNGLMIAAFARAAAVFDDSHFSGTAKTAADFMLTFMRKPDGSLLHCFRDDRTGGPGYIDDYAFMIWGLAELYEATFEIRYLRAAIELNQYLLAHFWDKEQGGFFFTADNSEALISRRKEIHDGAIPSGNSVAAWNLLRLARITGNSEWEQMARRIFEACAEQVRQYPAGYAMLLTSFEFALGPGFQIVICGDLKRQDTRDMITALRSVFIPDHVLIFHPGNEERPEISEITPYALNQKCLEGHATAYVCRDFACNLPTTNIDEMLRLLHHKDS